MNLADDNIYYVYVYLDNKNVPYYVGKGKGKRAFKPHSNVVVPKCQTKIQFIDSFISEDDAFYLEKAAIKRWGRKKLGTGPLLNSTSGGQGFTKPHTEESKKKMSESLKGRTFSEDSRKKISESNKKAWELGTRKPMKGYPCRYVYITDGKKTKRVPENTPVPDGWRLGRTFFKNKV